VQGAREVIRPVDGALGNGTDEEFANADVFLRTGHQARQIKAGLA